ncbi:MAG: hypothetical protein MJZ26_07620 [Fibrobacter sp.]|nr:hypothetical protein [Fibrobacter sp.]
MKMNFHKFLGATSVAMTMATAMMVSACGDDGSSSNNVEREEDSSSSLVESSSSEEVSSSSEKSNLPKGARVATLKDMDKNISLGELFGTTVYLATGSKVGLYSLWVPDTAWIAFHSEMNDGEIFFDKSNGALMGASSIAVYDSLKNMLDKGAKLEFIMNSDEKLQYSLNGGKYQDTEVAKVAISGSNVTKADELKGKKLSCTSGDTTNTYLFYEGRFLQENSLDKKDISWSAGYYDIQRGMLLMMPTFYDQQALALKSLYVDGEFNLTSATGSEYKCKNSKFEFDSVDESDLVGEWVASKDGEDWTLELKKDGSHQLQAKEKGGTIELKTGVWSVFGDLLLMRNTGCLNPSSCSKAVKGVVSGLDKDKGFNYDHSDTGDPLVPTAWTVPLYE